MKNKRKWMMLASAGLVVMLLAVAALPVTAASNAPAPLLHRGGPGGFGAFHAQPGIGQQETFLADALGISVDELNAAQEAAREAAIQQAVDAGLITQAQADALLERGRFDMLRMMGRFYGFADAIDAEALLADALGVSVEELRAAKEAAANAALQQAVEDGRITQEQADQIQARRALADYLNAQGLRDSMRALYEDAVRGAVEAGVITQEQADAILSRQGRFDFFGGMKGFDGMRGHGGGMRFPGGMRGFQAPDSNTAPSGFFQQSAPAFGRSL